MENPAPPVVVVPEVPKPQPKHNKTVLVIIIVILLIIGGGVYLFLQKKKTSVTPHQAVTTKQSTNTVYKDIKQKLQETMK